MYQVFSGQKPPVNRKEMPGPYGQLIDDCWQEDPEERPTFASILQRLRGMYKDERQRLHDLQLAAGEAPATPGSQPSPQGPAPVPSNSSAAAAGGPGACVPAAAAAAAAAAAPADRLWARPCNAASCVPGLGSRHSARAPFWAPPASRRFRAALQHLSKTSLIAPQRD